MVKGGATELRSALPSTTYTLVDKPMNKAEHNERYPDASNRRAKKRGASSVSGSSNTSRYSRLGESDGTPRRPTDFLDGLSPVIVAAIAGCLSRGELISFSLTSDGGAICITFLDDDGRHKFYASSANELKYILDAAID